jgi:putative oxygen-independent coproporphyrinogen III oxidase
MYLSTKYIFQQHMSGIYLHIPFCKKRCNYCDFYSTTQLKLKEPLVKALAQELIFRKDYLAGQKVETIYFGGGTPSLLSAEEFASLIQIIRDNYNLEPQAEITIEANPDDLNLKYIESLSKTPVNRISIGIQSFNDDFLKTMNRRHTAKQAIEAIENCRMVGFNNLSADLIYGLPGLSNREWQQELDAISGLNIQHLSAYHLTYEKGTIYEVWLRNHKIEEISEEDSLDQFKLLISWAKTNGFEHYEISNFAKEGFYSKHNTSYWNQKPYLGVGPAAHSYNLETRSWNVSNLSSYLEGIENNEPKTEIEILTETDKFNDYIITSLRTCWGIDLNYLDKNFSPKMVQALHKIVEKQLNSNKLNMKENHLKLTETGIFISDQIISELMFIGDE